MQRDTRAFLWDVGEAIDAIQGFMGDVSAANYAANALLHSAVERKFEIIGEALNQLSRYDPALAARIPDLPRIVAFRNLLIHGYAAVDHLRVWRIVHESLPALRSAVGRMLAEFGEP